MSLSSDDENSDYDELTLYDEIDSEGGVSTTLLRDRTKNQSAQNYDELVSTKLNSIPFQVTTLVTEQTGVKRKNFSKALLRREITPTGNIDNFRTEIINQQIQGDISSYVPDSDLATTADNNGDFRSSKDIRTNEIDLWCDIKPRLSDLCREPKNNEIERIKGQETIIEDNYFKLLQSQNPPIEECKVKRHQSDDVPHNGQNYAINKRHKTVAYEQIDSEDVCVVPQKNESEKDNITMERNTTQGIKKNNTEEEQCAPRVAVKKSSLSKVKAKVSLTKEKKRLKTSYKCDICSREFNQKYKLRDHYLTHTGEKMYECNECGKSFALAGNLKHHIITKHSTERNHKCTVCLKSFKTTVALKYHMNVVHNKIRFKCDTCGKDFSALQTVKTHILNQHGYLFGNAPVNELKCLVCDKVLSSAGNLKLHMQIHEGNQNYICETCGALFSRKTDRDRHHMIHTGEKPYKCKQCDYSCIRPGDFNRHMLNHGDRFGGQRKHTCPYCEKTLVRKCEMRAHIAICNGALKSADKPQFHMKLFHEDREFFNCKVCYVPQGSKYKLESHMIKEHGKTAHVCDECGLTLKSNNNLKRHKKNIHSNRDIPCPLCSKVFKCDRYLKEHRKLVHEKS